MSAAVESLPLPNTPSSEAVTIGPREIVPLHPNMLNEVAQVRQSYDPEGLGILARSMVKGDMPEGLERSVLSNGELSDKLELIHPLAVAKFSSLDCAQKYLDAHAAHYGLDIPRAAESLEPADDGFYYLLIAGHRRKRAIKILQEMFNIPDSQLTIATNVYEDIDFSEALGLQLRENIHERPPIEEEARSIERYAQLLQAKTGKQVSNRRLAGELGMDDKKISNALAFARLPSDIQKLTAAGISYGTVAKLKPLYDAYLVQYDAARRAGDKLAETREIFAGQSVHLVVNKIRDNHHERNQKKAIDIIKANIALISHTTPDYVTEQLFEFAEAEAVGARLKVSDRSTAKRSLRHITYLAMQGRLEPEWIDPIERARLIRALGGAVIPEAEQLSETGSTLLDIANEPHAI